MNEEKMIPQKNNQNKNASEMINYINNIISTLDIEVSETGAGVHIVVPKCIYGKTSMKNVIQCFQYKRIDKIMVTIKPEYKNSSCDKDWTFYSIAELKARNIEEKIRAKYNELCGLKVNENKKSDVIEFDEFDEFDESVFEDIDESVLEHLDIKEGNTIIALIKRKKRNAKARKLKFEDFKNKNGEIYCEVCMEKDIHVLDVHHNETEVADMKENHVTKLEDLKILCANCHRKVHGYKISVEELKRKAN
jgi:hypothetical protein